MRQAGIEGQVADGLLKDPLGPAARRRLGLLVWTALIADTALAALAAYWSWSRKTIDPDPYIFGIAAKRLLAGQRLYVDFFEAKPPLATLFYAVPGALWPRSYLAVCWFMAALLMLQGLVWVWWFRPRLATGAACLWFVVLYPATFRDFSWRHERQPQAKLIAIGTSCAYDEGLPLVESNYLAGKPTPSLFTYAMTKRFDCEHVNIGPGQDFTISEFARRICDRAGYDFDRIQFDPARYVGVRSKCLVTEKLHQWLPYDRFTPLDEGLDRTFAWMQDQLDDVLRPE